MKSESSLHSYHLVTSSIFTVGVVSLSPKLHAGGPPLVGCPLLII